MGVIVLQRGFSERDAVQIILFQFDWCMVFFRCHFLIEDVFDVIGPIGIERQRFLYCRDNSGRTLLIFKIQNF